MTHAAPSQQLRSASGEPRVTVVAVLGTGSSGTRYLNELERLSKLTAVEAIAVPIRTERYEALRREGKAVAHTLEEATAHGATRCIVATDTGRHAADVREALGLGMEVLVEKPMASTAEEAAELQQLADRATRLLYVGCVLRFSTSLNTFGHELHRLGRLHSVQIVCQSYLPDWRPQRPYQDAYSARASEGGVLRDLIHEVDYAGWLFGWPAAVQARLRNLGRLGIEAEELAEVNWVSPAGASVSLTLDYLTRPPRRQVIACGEQGTLVWDGIARTVMVDGASLPVPSQEDDNLFIAQAQAFLRACDPQLTTRDSRLATAEDGVKALAVCDAARRASVSRREETVVFP